jgi:hypothetical protein
MASGETAHSKVSQELFSDLHLENSVTVPTLLQTIATLNSEKSELHNEVARLTAEINSLRPVAPFQHFSKLPPEVRALVWRFAFTASQIFIMRCWAAPGSNVNNVALACKEAHQEFKRLQLPYFRLDDSCQLYCKGMTQPGENLFEDCYEKMAKCKATPFRTHFTPESDILWVTEDHRWFHEFCELYCGVCHEPWKLIRRSVVQPLPPNCPHMLTRRVRALAIDNNAEWDEEEPGPVPLDGQPWAVSDGGDDNAGDIQLSYCFNLAQIFIVINEASQEVDYDDIIFEEPRIPPLVHYYGTSRWRGYVNVTPMPDTWDIMAARRVQKMLEYKARRTASLKGTKHISQVTF